MGNADEKYADIKEGDVAPFSGKLLTNEALAKILSQYQLELDQCKINGETKLSEKSL